MNINVTISDDVVNFIQSSNNPWSASSVQNWVQDRINEIIKPINNELEQIKDEEILEVVKSDPEIKSSVDNVISSSKSDGSSIGVKDPVVVKG
jgi:hypothetical protein